MNYIRSQLQPGEQILFQINRGRKWFHYLLLFFTYCVLLPVMIWVLNNFAYPIFASILPQNVVMLIWLGLFLLIGAAMLVDILHFLVDGLALTDRRIIGRVQGSFSGWVFRKINVPVSEIESVRVAGGFASPSLVIRLRNGKSKLIVRNLGPRQQFAAKLTELIDHPA